MKELPPRHNSASQGYLLGFTGYSIRISCSAGSTLRHTPYGVTQGASYTIFQLVLYIKLGFETFPHCKTQHGFVYLLNAGERIFMLFVFFTLDFFNNRLTLRNQTRQYLQ